MAIYWGPMSDNAGVTRGFLILLVRVLRRLEWRVWGDLPDPAWPGPGTGVGRGR